ncbi:thymidylate synthase [Bacillus atrophaeus]|uniref:thymidylate synthase n=1 Tax=Bacillus atrophaeus TaxID=1452 RepID=UPI00227E63A3|nr:thymidylate synthase [Bacillus atrophaeus]MCY7948022.1 thymidylate synthase [Bacillus atrophaeus]MCY8098033.1 thymidylate synthase [Bacillus atrophaeus]MCY9169957.1 thymidylate synthase [Bacillus atrophaeus]MEC0740682.1 thymidylate synthase [Bacillus atrophaeus]MEC0747054.1 thymidylate synthase [Bacillus atrophaeus]
MSIADIVYKDLINKVDREGKWDRGCNVRPKWKDGTPAYTKSIINAQMKFDNSYEIPLLTQKRVPCFDPVKEILWIWRDKSNEVDRLRQMGCTVWDEWEREDGTIGRAYGWQLGNKCRKVKIDTILNQMAGNREVSGFKLSPENTEEYVLLDQVDYLLYALKSNPSSRRIKTTLWCVEDLDDMALEPCVYETHWQLWDGKLNLTVNVRSNDLGLGNPYNIYQYSILHRLIAQVTGHKVGEICFNIDNAHIYDRHMDHLKNQIRKPMHRAPKVWINPDIKSFYDFTIDDIKVLDYEHEKGIKLEVAE